MLDEKKLRAAGYKPDSELVEAHTEAADKNEMHETGPYVVHGVWRKGLVTIVAEQNTAAEDIGGGMSAIIQHPAVCVISSPKGAVAANPDDTDHVLRLAAELS